MQFFAQRLRYYDAAGFVHSETSVHSGIGLWVQPSIPTIIDLHNAAAERRHNSANPPNQLTSTADP
jgi:hypothetical protein